MGLFDWLKKEAEHVVKPVSSYVNNAGKFYNQNVIKPVQNYGNWVNQTNQNVAKSVPKLVTRAVDTTTGLNPINIARGSINAGIQLSNPKTRTQYDPQNEIAKFGLNTVLGRGDLKTRVSNKIIKDQSDIIAKQYGAPSGAFVNNKIMAQIPEAQRNILQQRNKLESQNMLNMVLGTGNKAKTSQTNVATDIKKVLSGGTVKEKALQTRLSQNKSLPKSVRSMLNGTYVVKDNPTTIKDAKNAIRLDPQGAELRALNPQNAIDVHINAELFNKYISSGNHEKAMTFINNANETNLGQMVQILSQYDKTTPQGAVRFAQKNNR